MISIFDASKPLRASVLAMHVATKEMRKVINDDMRSTFNPVWQKAVSENLGGFHRADAMMLMGTRIAAGNPPELYAARSRAKVGRALKPVDQWPLVEWGVSGKRESTYTRRTRYGSHQVTRKTMTGWPKRTRGGRIAHPAANELKPRILSYWTQSIIKTFMDAAEKGAD